MMAERMLTAAREFLVEEQGATVTESAVLLALVGAGAIASLEALGAAVKDVFDIITAGLRVR